MKKIALLILDGWGLSEEKENNAIAQAKTPNFDCLWKNFPHSKLEASGEAVGLPEGQMGNSEVGHLNIGAGRIVYQGLEKINKAFENDLLAKNPLLLSSFDKVKKFNSSLHVKGLVSSGGVHSHNRHLYALIDLAKKNGVPRVFVHAITDGRDAPPTSAGVYLEELQSVCKDSGIACLASVSGRYYAMDRDNNWDRTECAFKAISKGEGKKYDSPNEAIEQSYKAGKTDEFIEPCVFPVESNGKVCEVSDHDVMIFFNFRADRARQLAKKFSEDCHAQDFTYITMTEYDSSLSLPSLFKDEVVKKGLAETLSKAGKKQFHVAETEKYAHVTFFFNGGREEPFSGEERFLIPSNKVATHDMAPEMKAREIADAVIDKMKNGENDFMLANFANLDMVGHSGKMEETIKATEAVDESLGRIIKESEKNGYVLIITADHGNAEKMLDTDSGKPYTAHTVNPVPFIVADKKSALKSVGKLADIAPTILKIMGIDKPETMTGASLLSDEK